MATKRLVAEGVDLGALYRQWGREEDRRRTQQKWLKDFFADAKAKGLNPKAMRAAFKEHYRLTNETFEEANKRELAETDVELYLVSLAGVRTHEDDAEPDHDPETGEIKEPQAKPVQTGPRFGSPTTNAGAVAVEAPAINSQHGAESAEDEAQVATVSAPSSAQLIPEPAPKVTEPASGQVAAVAGEGASTLPAKPKSKPAEGSPSPTSAAPGDRRADSSPVATVVADRTKPNPWCMDPEECGVEASWNYMCLKCQAVKSGRERAGAALQ